MLPASAFSAGLLPSSPGSSTGGFGSDDSRGGGGGPGVDDLSLPSLADSFHSDLERHRLPSGSGGGAGIGDGWGSIEGARLGAADDDDDGWDRHGTPTTVRKSRSRPQHRSSSSSPSRSSTSIMTPLAAASAVAYPSSYVDLDTPQADTDRHLRRPAGAPMDRADENSLSNASSASSRALSDLTDVSALDGAGGTDDDLFAQSPPKAGPSASLLGGSTNGGKPRGGRMSIAGGELGGSRMGQSLTLREQEKALDQKDREIFDLKLKIHFLTLRLEQQSPQTHSALEDENMQLKVAYGRLKAECKKNKKYSLECVKVIEELKRELENARASGSSAGAGGLAAARAAREREAELSDKVREEKERRRALEEEVERLRDRADKEARQLRDSEDEIQRLQKANAELEQENEAVHDHAEAAKDELRQTQEELDRRVDESTRGGPGDTEFDELQRRAEELEDDLETAHGQLEAQKTSIETLRDEREELLEERDDLHKQLDRAEAGAGGALDRSMARGGSEESERERNELRDRLAAAGLELEKKESILEEKERALEEAYAELDGADQHWVDEVKVTKSQNEELKDVLQECEKENEALRDEVSELRNEIADLQAKLAELEDLNTELADRLEEHMLIQQNEKAEREAELLANNEEIQALAARVQELEDELQGHLAKEVELERELDAQDAQIEDTHSLHDQVVITLKEKHAQTKGDLDEVVELYAAAQKDLELKKSQVKELSALAADLEGKQRTDSSLKRRLTEEREELVSKLRKVEDEKARETSGWKRELEDSEAHWKRQLQDKDSVISRLTLDVERAQTRLSEREQDLQAMQDGTRRLGETHSEDRFALELEVERYRRDLEHAEDDLERTRKDLEKKEAALGQREDALAGLHAEIRDVEAKLSAERQSRLNVSDKLDSAQRGFRNAEQEANGLRERVEDLEQRLTDDQRALLTTRTQSETQRKESSQLLLTVFQNLNKILGTDDRATPAANFGIFRDTLLSRLRTLGQLQHNFDKKVKACETVFTERLTGMKKQLDAKWRQLDHFETSVRKVELVKTQWRNKLAQKQGELDSLQAKHADLAAQLSGVKGMTRSESTSDAKAATTRIATLERRLNNALNQMSTYEEKLASARSKMTAAEARWDVRVREYENRLKAAEEKVKAEKQGGKERAAQLDMQVEDLKKQVEMAKRRAEKLQGLVPSNARASARSSP